MRKSFWIILHDWTRGKALEQSGPRRGGRKNHLYPSRTFTIPYKRLVGDGGEQSLPDYTTSNITLSQVGNLDQIFCYALTFLSCPFFKQSTSLTGVL